MDDIRNVVRNREPPESGIMSDILWSDPQPFPGRGPSKRGVGLAFGPDITKQFLDSNGLSMIVRSHEVRDEGYLMEHDGKLVTVFVRQIIVIKWAIKAQLSGSIATANLRTSNLLPSHTYQTHGICREYVWLLNASSGIQEFLIF